MANNGFCPIYLQRKNYRRFSEDNLVVWLLLLKRFYRSNQAF